MARAFLQQSIHLAARTGVFSEAEKSEVEREARTQNPITVVNEWVEIALPSVMEIAGEKTVAVAEARLVGALMLVALSGANPKIDVERYLNNWQCGSAYIHGLS